jgi:hypothetical protein
MSYSTKIKETRLDSNEFKGSLANPYPVYRPPPVMEAAKGRNCVLDHRTLTE